MTVNEVLTIDNQQEKIGALLLHGYRFVTMTVVDKGEEFDIFYHFDLDYDMVNYQLVLKKGDVLPSISNICFAAVIVENEIQDLFGITVSNLAIDYEKHFLFAPDAPDWNVISQNWENVLHFPSEAGKGLVNLEYEEIINTISNSI